LTYPKRPDRVQVGCVCQTIVLGRLLRCDPQPGRFWIHGKGVLDHG